MPVRRINALGLIHVTRFLRQADVYAASQRDVALAIEKALRGLAHRDQRSRTSGLHSEARALKVELVRNMRRKIVLVVAEQDLKIADECNEFYVPVKLEHV
jgi:hypothetical protein